MAKTKAKKRLAINGFGRIGRAAFKIALDSKKFDIVAINDLTDPATLAHLLRYDSIYGTYQKQVKHGRSALIVDGKSIRITSIKEPAKLPWKKLKVDVVLECTGRFVKDGAAQAHIKAGAKKVVISAPTEGSGDVPTQLIGVNAHEKTDAQVVSNASCTTNCVAPVAKIMVTNFGVKRAAMTTIHSYTADQNLQDGPHNDLRRARAAAMNIVPTTSGAAISTTEVIPELEGLFDGFAIRVPTPVVSLSDFTFVVKKKTTKEAVNRVFKRATSNPIYKKILTVTDEPMVSSDFIGNPHSAIVDLLMTNVIGGDLVKIVAWYDNEWGYSNRLVELAASH
ncbi:MAG: type I glyceraldehyde-3-phosphate dehydrogenase [Patescibacteria group bacterium]